MATFSKRMTNMREKPEVMYILVQEEKVIVFVPHAV